MKSDREIKSLLKRLVREPTIVLAPVAAMIAAVIMTTSMKLDFPAFTRIGLLLSAVFVGILVSYVILIIREKSKRTIFLSYNFADKAFAKKLAKDLQSSNCTVLDPDKDVLVGENIKEKISSLIEHSDGVIVVISKNIINSTWIDEELSRALKAHKVVMPVKVDDSKLPEMIQDLKHVEMADNYDQGLGVLRMSIKAIVLK